MELTKTEALYTYIEGLVCICSASGYERLPIQVVKRPDHAAQSSCFLTGMHIPRQSCYRRPQLISYEAIHETIRPFVDSPHTTSSGLEADQLNCGLNFSLTGNYNSTVNYNDGVMMNPSWSLSRMLIGRRQKYLSLATHALKLTRPYPSLCGTDCVRFPPRHPHPPYLY